MASNGAGVPKTKEESRQEFRVIEHAVVEEKVRHASSDLYRTETIVPVAIAVIYAWLYGGEGGAVRMVPSWMWWIPVVVAGFGAWRQYLRYQSLWGYHYYLEALEQEIYDVPPIAKAPPKTAAERRAAASPPRGWTAYWLWGVSPTFKLGKLETSRHGFMRLVFWGLLIVGTAVLAAQQT